MFFSFLWTHGYKKGRPTNIHPSCTRTSIATLLDMNKDKNMVMVPKSTGQDCSSAIRLRSAERHSIWSFSSDCACRVLSTWTLKRKKVGRKATIDNSTTKLKSINQIKLGLRISFTFNADPDPAFHLKADPDQVFRFTADPDSDPNPRRRMWIFDHWSTEPPGLHIEPPHRATTAPFWISKDHNFDINEDPQHLTLMRFWIQLTKTNSDPDPKLWIKLFLMNQREQATVKLLPRYCCPFFPVDYCCLFTYICALCATLSLWY